MITKSSFLHLLFDVVKLFIARRCLLLCVFPIYGINFETKERKEISLPISFLRVSLSTQSFIALENVVKFFITLKILVWQTAKFLRHSVIGIGRVFDALFSIVQYGLACGVEMRLELMRFL